MTAQSKIIPLPERGWLGSRIKAKLFGKPKQKPSKELLGRLQAKYAKGPRKP